MKKDGVYRYSLQWSENTEDRIRAGEFLEKLGNRKSAVIITALNAYLDMHPEAMKGEENIKVSISGYDEKRIESMIKRLIQEHGVLKTNENEYVQRQPSEIPTLSSEIAEIDDDVAKMLANLDLFNGL